MSNPKQSVKIIGFVVSLVCILFFVFSFSETEPEKQKAEFEKYYRIYSLNVGAENFSFAGDVIPFEEPDILERYDRELLTNVYWQSQTILMIKRAHRFFPTVERILEKNNVPDDFKYLLIAESGIQNVSSPAGASGYWQFLDKTGIRYGLEINEEIDERYHLEKSTQAACDYFNEAYKEFQNWSLVAASYNMGIEGVKRQLQQQQVKSYYDLYLNTETARYVFRAISFKRIMQSPQQYGFYIQPNHFYKNLPTSIILLNQSIEDLYQLCAYIGCNYKTLKTYNPWLKKSKLTVAAGKTYYLNLPKDKLNNAVLEKAGMDTFLLKDYQAIR